MLKGVHKRKKWEDLFEFIGGDNSDFLYNKSQHASKSGIWNANHSEDK